MPTETFSVNITPKTAATKALGILKRSKLTKFRLIESGIKQQGEGFMAFARWEEDALFFASSAEVSVNAQRPLGQPTRVVVSTHGEQCGRLADRIRKSL